MLGDTSFKKNVAASVIASVVVILLLQPIINYLFRYVPRAAASFSTSLANSFYKAAALGQRDWYSFVVFELIFIAMGVFFLEFPFFYRAIVMQKGLHHNIIKLAYNEKMKTIIYIFTIFANCIGVLCVLLIMSVAYVDLQLNTQFQQRLNIICPYITDTQFKEFKASWATMKTRDDYLKIDFTIKEIALKNNIALPEPLIK